MRVALIQMNSRAAARDENVDRACEFIAEAAHQKAEIVVLPEFFNNEYFPQYRDARYMDYAEADDGYTQTRMKAQARRHGIHIVSTIFEMDRPGRILGLGVEPGLPRNTRDHLRLEFQIDQFVNSGREYLHDEGLLYRTRRNSGGSLRY